MSLAKIEKAHIEKDLFLCDRHLSLALAAKSLLANPGRELVGVYTD